MKIPKELIERYKSWTNKPYDDLNTSELIEFVFKFAIYDEIDDSYYEGEDKKQRLKDIYYPFLKINKIRS